MTVKERRIKALRATVIHWPDRKVKSGYAGWFSLKGLDPENTHANGAG
jgi:hypothetical protein